MINTFSRIEAIRMVHEMNMDSDTRYVQSMSYMKQLDLFGYPAELFNDKDEMTKGAPLKHLPHDELREFRVIIANSNGQMEQLRKLVSELDWQRYEVMKWKARARLPDAIRSTITLALLSAVVGAVFVSGAIAFLQWLKVLP